MDYDAFRAEWAEEYDRLAAEGMDPRIAAKEALGIVNARRRERKESENAEAGIEKGNSEMGGSD